MPSEEEIRRIFSGIILRELDTLDIFLTSKASRTSITLEEYISSRIAQGTSRDVIRDDLLRDLNEGGRIFGEFRSAIRTTANGSINRIRDGAEFQELGVEESYRWAAVLVNTCPDCLERHGQEKTWEEWEAEGLPRTGATVCRENCKCMLVPAGSVVFEPIKRNRR